MKIIAAAATTALLLSGSALAQTSTPAPTTPPATEAPAAGATTGTTTGAGATAGAAAGAGGSAIVTLPAAAQGGTPAYFLSDDLDDEDVYGADNEDIGEVEDFVFAADGTIAAVVVEVGGFLGIGEKDVLVDWNAMEVVTEGDDLRLLAPALTREALEAAEGVDLEAMMLGDD